MSPDPSDVPDMVESDLEEYIVKEKEKKKTNGEDDLPIAQCNIPSKEENPQLIWSCSLITKPKSSTSSASSLAVGQTIPPEELAFSAIKPLTSH